MLDKFDKVFCWTITVLVVVAGVYFLATTHSIWQGIFVVGLCTVCVYSTWHHIAAESLKLIQQGERDLFLSAAVRYFRIASDSETGLTGVPLNERYLVLLAWERYRIQVLDRRTR